MSEEDKIVRKTLLVGLLAANAASIASIGCWAVEEDQNAYLWKPQVKSVSVFKNGLGFYLREGDAVLRDGWVVSGGMPPAAFGALAIFSLNKNELVDIISSGPGEIVEFNGKDAPKDNASKRARLESSKNLKVELTYKQDSGDRAVAGTLVSIGPEYAVLKTDSNSFAAPIDAIKKLQILENPVRAHVSSDNGKSPAKTTLGMVYLRKGITWIPEYTLNLIDDTSAELTLRGTLVNEAEDLVHCDVSFVVGVPNFLHADQLSPLASGQVIRTLDANLLSNSLSNTGQIATLGGVSKTTDSPVASGGREEISIGNLPQWESSGSSDFTVYTRKNLTVRQREKTIVTLFVKKIAYGHVYRWSAPSDIRHSLILKNDTDSAWTTGPCLALSEGNALSEDLLKYVPKGGKGELPVTTAVNLTHEQKETETDRKVKAYEVSKESFADLVTVSGELKVHNFGKGPADLEIELPVKGKPVTASDAGSIVLDTSNLQMLERSGKITWKLTLKAGEAKTITYQYERYVVSK